MACTCYINPIEVIGIFEEKKLPFIQTDLKICGIEACLSILKKDSYLVSKYFLITTVPVGGNYVNV